jgi:hypothetical protein
VRIRGRAVSCGERCRRRVAIVASGGPFVFRLGADTFLEAVAESVAFQLP